MYTCVVYNNMHTHIHVHVHVHCTRMSFLIYLLFIIITSVHVEGPFIKKGAHAEVHVQDTVSYSLIQECYGSLDNMTIITLAPELPGAMEVIPLLVDKRIVVGLGTIVICILYCVICKGLL